ncbi:hypothetical protein F4818DRAFT_426298 [Hypoxylon cercidicola]|nr:hypothetical protein F4818DRAFT_426298 [Hypoxylon cercidicola]
MSSSSSISAFEAALGQFMSDLKKKDRDKFRNTTLNDLIDEVEKIQKKQQSQRRGRNLARLKPFIEAMDQFGKVVEVFANTSEMVAFVWGPMKFLLQIAGTFAEAFHELLDTYEKLGESFPLLLQYERLFREDANMLRVLTIMYKDILEFHRQALRYFQQPMLKQLFQATWKTYKTRFQPLIDNIRGHGVLVQNQATLSQIEDYRKSTQAQNYQLQSILDEQENRRLREVLVWLSAPNVSNDQSYYSKIREEYPGTGRWLLDVPAFKEWFDPRCPTIPPLLWMTGMPGAGKTILASLVVEEAMKLTPSPITLFFYCKSGDIDKNNFASIGRSFLSQLLQVNKDILLPFYYDKFSNSTTAVLDTYAVIENLLEVALLNCPSVYIIIDGIDECPRGERKDITKWFRNIVENLQPPNQDRVRCLFVSQHDGIASKDFNGLTSLKIDSKNNEGDIKAFSVVEAAKIQSQFPVSDDTRNRIASKMQSTAKGMFLLAKLISINLLQQTCVGDIEAEIEDDRIPKELSQAYSRILTRLLDQAAPREKAASETLLRWLVCAKRTLKWHEIQAARSIHIESQSVDVERRRFCVSSKDLCGSLVEIRDGGRVEFVHTTARLFMACEQTEFDVSQGDILLASLAVDYLNMAGFRSETEKKSLILNGYYGFMDYAVPYWVRHLEEGVDNAEEDDPILNDLAESVEAFLQLHYTSPTKPFPISQGNSKRLRFFLKYPFHADLQQAVASARKELTFLGEIKRTEIALDLADIVKNIRVTLEETYTDAAQTATAARMEEMYGHNIFKCPRLSCRYFHDGFQTAEQRDQHIDKHVRPYRCAISGCFNNTVGFVTEKELVKHIKETHGSSNNEDTDYPEDEEIARSRKAETRITEENVDPELREERPDPVPRAPKRPRISAFTCPHCQRVFKKKYNLESHLTIHSDQRPHSCSECDAAFARLHDLNRHRKTHQEKEFICGGELDNGQRWGCQKKFARADTLQNHYKTASGQACIPPNQRVPGPQV